MARFGSSALKGKVQLPTVTLCDWRQVIIAVVVARHTCGTGAISHNRPSTVAFVQAARSVHWAGLPLTH
jgi:hypothetical protein